MDFTFNICSQSLTACVPVCLVLLCFPQMYQNHFFHVFVALRVNQVCYLFHAACLLMPNICLLNKIKMEGLITKKERREYAFKSARIPMHFV